MSESTCTVVNTNVSTTSFMLESVVDEPTTDQPQAGAASGYISGEQGDHPSILSLSSPDTGNHKLSILPPRFLELIFVLSSRLQWLWSKRGTTAAKIIGTVTFMVTCLALWPTFAGTDIAKKANVLAQWTADKDFYEFCESVSIVRI